MISMYEEINKIVINTLIVRNTFGCFSLDISVCKHKRYVSELNKNNINNAKGTKKNNIQKPPFSCITTLSKKTCFEQPKVFKIKSAFLKKKTL